MTAHIFESSPGDQIVNNRLFRTVDDVLYCYSIKVDANNNKKISEIASGEEATLLLEILLSNQKLIKKEEIKAPSDQVVYDKMERIIGKTNNVWIMPSNKDSYLGTHLGAAIYLIDGNFLPKPGNYQLPTATEEYKLFWAAVYDGLISEGSPSLVYNPKKPYETIKNYVLARRYYNTICAENKLRAESMVKFYPFFGTMASSEDKHFKNKHNLTSLLSSIFDLEYVEAIRHILGLLISLVPLKLTVAKIITTPLIDIESINRTGIRTITHSQPTQVGKRVKMVTTQEQIWPKSSISTISTVPHEYTILRDLKKRYWYGSFSNKQVSDHIAQFGYKMAKEWARSIYTIRWKWVDLMRRYKLAKLQFIKNELKSLNQPKNSLEKLEDFKAYYRVCNPKAYSGFILKTLDTIFMDSMEEIEMQDYQDIESKIIADIKALKSRPDEKVMPSYLLRPAEKSIVVRDEIESQMFSFVFDIHSTFSGLEAKVGQEISEEDLPIKAFFKRNKPPLIKMAKWLNDNEATDFIINTGASMLTGRNFYQQVLDTCRGNIRNNNLFLHFQPPISSSNIKFITNWILSLNLGLPKESQFRFDLKSGRSERKIPEKPEKTSEEKRSSEDSDKGGFTEKLSKKDYKAQKRDYEKPSSDNEEGSDNNDG